jgi:alkanesulfonate monooxygenase SsuD/methylene tetrahydromethanopterin reductase-like flavin-dependent oxidoreductase (luciferase family)
MHHLLEEIEFADQLGLDVFGIGERHRAEFLDSAPVVILSAAAVRIENIRLTSAVTVLSASDPVRVFQEFATIDLISRGRAEIGDAAARQRRRHAGARRCPHQRRRAVDRSPRRRSGLSF